MSASEDHKRLQLAIEAAGLDLWENDLVAGKVIHPATQTFRELGYEAQEVGDSLAFWMDILHPDDLPAMGTALEAYRNGRADNYRAEFRLRTKDGRWIWYANYGKVMSGAADVGMHRFIGVTFNIDDRKQREEELARINQLLSVQNQQLDQMNGHLEKLSTTDPLTKLHNRRAINERLHRLVSTDKHPSALLFVDLDNFKKTNDLYGHDIGDVLLCQVAQRLQSCVDAGDLIARFGGDEFVLLIGDPENAPPPFRSYVESICARVLSILAEPYIVGDLVLHSYGSVGVACFPDDGWTVDELTKRADIALYRAKNKGRNRHCFFQPNMETELQYQDNIETELRTALKTRQLELLYQIQVDSELRPVGAEALLRWHHPARGLLSPIEFLPDAVASGLIHDIEELVLDTACATLGKWQNDPVLRDMTLAVNITAKSFEHPAFVLLVTSLLEKYRLPPGRLCLELTEHIKAQSFPDTARIINQLRAHGVRFALDDFGTGYSSLESLKYLKFDQIKLDAAFVADITDNPISQAILAGVISIAGAMQIEILAECVERHDQLEHLVRRGIEYYQGYLFGKPMPRSVVEAALLSAFGAQTA
jgi:diguanylate cyclase (GGDEF)-like protein/PAS domain S-box-containing protein